MLLGLPATGLNHRCYAGVNWPAVLWDAEKEYTIYISVFIAAGFDGLHALLRRADAGLVGCSDGIKIVPRAMGYGRTVSEEDLGVGGRSIHR